MSSLFYKFRSLENFTHIETILRDKKAYFATTQEMDGINDEGESHRNSHPSIDLYGLIDSVENFDSPNPRSFCITRPEEKAYKTMLWEKHADKGRGIAIRFRYHPTDHQKTTTLTPVEYLVDLSQGDGRAKPKDFDWECEWRFISTARKLDNPLMQLTELGLEIEAVEFTQKTIQQMEFRRVVDLCQEHAILMELDA